MRAHAEPLRVVSMKTPGVRAHRTAGPAPGDVPSGRAGAPGRAPQPVPRIRALSEVNAHATPPRGLGNLAPPRDPKESRARRVRDAVIWGSVAVILACGVTLAIWFLAR